MGIRGELYSTRITCEGRTYFFNVKENRMGDVFLTVVESKPTEAENFDRRSIVVFRDDMKDFLKAFQNALKFMEKGDAALTPPTFEPTAGSAARKRPSRATESSASTAAGGTEKKRRVVVKRKPSGEEPA